MNFLDLLANGVVPKYSTDILLLVLGYILCALLGYILGSLNFALIISKTKYHDDIRKYGSKNAGMTNMLRTYGKKDAALTFLGDALKTALAIFLGMLIMGRYNGGNYMCAIFAIIGHIFPCFFGFRGGKGVVAAAVTILMLNPLAFAVIIVMFVIIVAISKYISLGSVICAMAYPLVINVLSAPAEKGTASIFALIISIIVIIMHKDNIKRLMTGKESKISLGKKKTKKFTVSQENKNNK